MKNFKKIILIGAITMLLSLSTIFVVYAKFSYSTQVVEQTVTMPDSLKEQLNNAKVSTTSVESETASTESSENVTQ